MTEKTKVILRPVYHKNQNNLYCFDHYEIYGKVLQENVKVKKYQNSSNVNLTAAGAVFGSLMNAKLNKNLLKQGYLIIDQSGQEQTVILSEIPFKVEGEGEVSPSEVKKSCQDFKDTYVEAKVI